MSVTTETIECHRITVRGSDSAASWAVLMWCPRGIVTLHTDHGSWVYQWPPEHRAGPMPEFLARLNSSYAGRKFLGSAFMVEDVAKTVQHVKDDIIESRRDPGYQESVSADMARERWDAIDGVCDGGDLDAWLHADAYPDGHEYIVYSQDSSWTAMWERLWLPLIQPALLRLVAAL